MTSSIFQLTFSAARSVLAYASLLVGCYLPLLVAGANVTIVMMSSFGRVARRAGSRCRRQCQRRRGAAELGASCCASGQVVRARDLASRRDCSERRRRVLSAGARCRAPSSARRASRASCRAARRRRRRPRPSSPPPRARARMLSRSSASSSRAVGSRARRARPPPAAAGAQARRSSGSARSRFERRRAAVITARSITFCELADVARPVVGRAGGGRSSSPSGGRIRAPDLAREAARRRPAPAGRRPRRARAAAARGSGKTFSR